LQLALRANRMEEARRLAADLQGEKETFEVLHGLTRLSIKENGVEDSMGMLTELLNRFPLEREVRLLKARVLRATDNPLNLVQAKTHLRQLLQRTDAVSFQAAAFLLVDEGFPLFDEEKPAVVSHLRAHPYLEDGLQHIGADNLRLLIARTVRIDPDTALTMAQVLRGYAEAQPADDLLYASVAQLKEGGFAEAEKVLRPMEADPDLTPEQTLVLARQDFLAGRDPSAIDRLGEFLQRNPSNEGALRMVRTRLARPKAGLSTKQQLRLLDFLTSHPAAEVQDLLAAYRSKLELQPGKKAALLGEVRDRLGDTDPIALGLWLLQVGEYARALDLVGEGEAVADPDAFAVRFEALATMGRTVEARSLVNKASAGLTGFEVAFARARLEILEERMSEAAARLRVCVEEMHTEEESSRLFDIADLAFIAGDRELQLSLYERAFDGGMAFPEKHALFFMNHLLETEGVAAAKGFTGFMRTAFPDHPDFINNDCYLDTLLQQNHAAAIDDMSQLVREYPENPNYRVTLALAKLMGGYNDSALETLNDAQEILDLDALHTKMVFALVLAGNGKESMGRSMFGDVDRSGLLAEERQLVDEFLFGADDF
jgi:tetratricopeptide (TPR) repeat protein